MSFIKDIAKTAKTEIKHQKKDLDKTFKTIRLATPLNCYFLLDFILKNYKFENDFNELNDEIKELTPHLYFRINTNPKKYMSEIQDAQKYDKEKPGLLTDGIVLCDIYYMQKDITSKSLLKKLAKESEKKEDTVTFNNAQESLQTLEKKDLFDGIIIRISAHPQGKLNVNDITNLLKISNEINKKEFSTLFKKTTFNWEIYTMRAIIGHKPEKKINKFKNYNDMMSSLTKYLVKSFSAEGAEIKKYFGGFFNSLTRSKISFAEHLTFPDADGNYNKIEDE